MSFPTLGDGTNMTLQKKIISVEGRPIRRMVDTTLFSTVGHDSNKVAGLEIRTRVQDVEDLHMWHMIWMDTYAVRRSSLATRPRFHQHRDSYIISLRQQRSCPREYSKVEMRFLCLHGRGTNAKVSSQVYLVFRLSLHATVS